MLSYTEDLQKFNEDYIKRIDDCLLYLLDEYNENKTNKSFGKVAIGYAITYTLGCNKKDFDVDTFYDLFEKSKYRLKSELNGEMMLSSLSYNTKNHSRFGDIKSFNDGNLKLFKQNFIEDSKIFNDVCIRISVY